VAHVSHPGAAVPDGWPPQEARLELDLGGEGLVRIAHGNDVRSFGLDPWHRRFPLEAREFRIDAEVVARRPFGVPNRDPHLALAGLAWVELEVERLRRLLALVAAAAGALDGDLPARMLSAAEAALRLLEWPTATEPYVGQVRNQLSALWSSPPVFDTDPLPPEARHSIAAATRLLREELEGLRAVHPPRGRLALAGHAHIDLAWLWPLEETRRKVRRTFHTAVGLLERYPELTFVQSSAELHRMAQADDPELFARVRELVAAGRWEATGGMQV
jgi:alpha-mannosidase